MKIWTVAGATNYEGEQLLAVASSKEKALEICKNSVKGFVNGIKKTDEDVTHINYDAIDWNLLDNQDDWFSYDHLYLTEIEMDTYLA